MDKEKEIEEIAGIITERCEAELGQVHASSMNGKVVKTVDVRLIAKDIYNTGYRKADEVRKETAKAILQYFNDISVAISLYPEMRKSVNATKFYKWLKEKYGVEVDE